MRLSIVISFPHVAVHTCIHKKEEKKKKKKLSYVVSLFVICKLYMHSSGFLNCNLTPCPFLCEKKVLFELELISYLM